MNARHLVALVLVAAGGVALAMHAGRSLVAERDAALAAAAAADANARIWQAKYAEQSTHVERAVDTVRVRTVRYDTLRSVITEHLTDTVEVLKFIAAADSTVRACAALSADCSRFRVTADSTVRALNVWGGAGYRLYYTEQRHAKRWKRVAIVEVPILIAFGAWVRGQ